MDNLIVLGLILAAIALLALGQYLKIRREERQAALSAAGNGPVSDRSRTSQPPRQASKRDQVRTPLIRTTPETHVMPGLETVPPKGSTATAPRPAARVTPDEECRLRTQKVLAHLPPLHEVQLYSIDEFEALTQLDHAPIPIIFHMRDGYCEPIWKNFLVQGQHWAISGTSQFGKSSFVRALAYLLLFRGPEAVEVWAADPKVANFGFLHRLKHGRLYADLFTDEKQMVVDQSNVDGSLLQGYRDISREMTRRYGVFLNAGVDNLEEYNATHPERRLPYIVFLAEEAHDLAKDAKELHERAVKMGGGAGIIVLTSTQHPANVISTQIRMNTSCYVAFNVADGNNYVEAALGLAQGQTPRYNPAEVRERGTIVFRDRVLNKEVLGRVMYIPPEHRRALVDHLVLRFGRTQDVKDFQDELCASTQTPTALVAQLLATETVPLALENDGKTAESIGETGSSSPEIPAAPAVVSAATETTFQPSQSEKELSTTTVPTEYMVEATAFITASILRGKNQTETLTKECPGYSGRRHDAYKNLYQQLRAALVKQGVMLDKAKKDDDRAEAAIAA